MVATCCVIYFMEAITRMDFVTKENVEMEYNMKTGEIITGETASTLNEIHWIECVCETEGLERGDTLYVERSWDGGIEFNYIQPIKFCPVCGKRLPEFGAEHGRVG